MGKSLNTLSKLDYFVNDNYANIGNFGSNKERSVTVRTYNEKSLVKKRVNKLRLNLEWITL